MDSNSNDYTPVNLPTSGPLAYQPPGPIKSPTVKTPTDRRLRRIFTKPWLLIMIGLILVIALLWVYYLYSQRQHLQKQNSVPTPQPSVAPASEVPTGTSTSTWKTYTNKQYNYSIKIPPEWEYTDENNQNLSKISKGKVLKTTLFSTENTKTISIYFEGDWDHSYEPEVPVLQTNTTLDNKNTQLTVLQENKNMDPLGGEAIYTIPNFHDFRIETSYYPDISQILSTFKFTDSAEAQFCGGIAGTSCPDGYLCSLDGTYPDASGTCIKSNTKE